MMTEKNVFLEQFKYFKTEAARGRPFCSLDNPQQRIVHALDFKIIAKLKRRENEIMLMIQLMKRCENDRARKVQT